MARTSAVVTVRLDPRFTELLDRQNRLQTFLAGEHIGDFDRNRTASFIREQALALIVEVGEVLNETQWKPWAIQTDEAIVIDKQKYIGELADVYIFFMNLMLAGGVTTTELVEAVSAKQAKNLGRWTSGTYDGRSNKCPKCGRSYDDGGVTCYPAHGEILALCADTGEFVR